MEWLTYPQAGNRQAAQYLLTLRLAMVAVQLLSVPVAEYWVPVTHPALALAISAGYGLLAWAAWWWLRRWPLASPLPASLSLFGDLALITVWLWFTGGYINPLVSLLLLPIAMGMVIAPPAVALAVTGAGISAYTALILWHSPLGTLATGHGGIGALDSPLTRLHLLGMWGTFAVTALTLTLVVGALLRRLKRQQDQLAQFRESRLRDEQIIALGLSAAAVGHRLGTPLNTLGLLLEEARHQAGPVSPAAPGLTDDLDSMAHQLELCRQQLQQLTLAARDVRSARRTTLPARDWLARLRESATLLWPEQPIHWHMDAPDLSLAVDATLDQAVLNLLANAVDASPEWVQVSACAGPDGRLCLRVDDRGAGLQRSAERLGEAIIESEQGLGVGLFLSNATIGRHGGDLRAEANGDGTRLIVTLPTFRTPTGETPMGDTP